jgi:signal transduction histidine kinase
VSSVLDQVLALASLDFAPQPLIANDGGELAAISVGLSMLSEELDAAISTMNAATEAAIEAAQAKEDFLRNVSHELRTPLTAVVGMTELCLDTDLTSEQREYLAISKTALDSLLTLVNDLLDFSRLDAGKVELFERQFHTKELVESTVGMMSAHAQDRGLGIAYTIEPGVPHILLGDPDRLRQVLVNLLGNALKFTDTGTISVHVSRLDDVDDEIVLRFSVADSGIGIPEDRRKPIFDAFTQVDGSIRRKVGGTGLGLAIAHQIVVAMNGEISVVSEVGLGSDFIFTARFRPS